MPSSPSSPFVSMASDPRSLFRWLDLQALPLWCTLGRYDDGRFAEALTADGLNPANFQRARVSTRQMYVLAQAGRQEWRGPWKPLLEAGLRRYWSQFRTTRGDYRTLVSLSGEALDDTPWLYDQAFSLLAMASAAGVDVLGDQCRERSRELLARLGDRAANGGGWIEAGDRPYQANAHMHLLEAFLAWDEVDPAGQWREAAAAVVDLALNVFIDPVSGALHEFFDQNWRRLPAESGGLIEPGHQFEWAWLLVRFALRTGQERPKEAALRLYEIGAKGILPGREVACDELNSDLSVRSTRARLWPQSEWLKAALIMRQYHTRTLFADDVRRASRALAGYLLPDGRWYDKQIASSEYINEPAPASSLYHIVGAVAQLRALTAP